MKAVEFSQYDLTKLSENSIPGYKLIEAIGKGSTCITVKATKEKMGRPVVVKIFKPGILDHLDLEKAIKSLKNLFSESNLSIPLPRDYGTFMWNELPLKYVEMDFVEGISLGQFLRENINVDLQETLLNYIKEVGGTLRLLHDNGFTHGDLHENNILMVKDEAYQERPIFHFKVIDFIGITSIEELRQYELNDLEYFKENFSKIIRKYASTPSGDVDIKKLGERLSYIYENLVKNKYSTFEEVRRSLSEKLPERDKIHFEPPFTYLIFETYDVNDPLWLRRFELEATIYHYFTDFRPLICSGPRGCGKTIYLRSLSFIPKLIKIGKNDESLRNKIAFFRNIFGIYFACRQGEFKVFSKKLYDFNLKTELFLKHLLVLKILRRTVSLIEEAYSEKIFTGEPKIELILGFLSPYLALKFEMTSTSRERPFKELASILRNEENQCMDNIGKESKYPSLSELLNEKNLITFFEIVKKAVPELSDFKFYIIFDDLSEPQVNLEMQKILNCLIACHNGVYCCKFSTDKYAYTFEDMFGKALQVPHDYTYLDLSIIDDYEGYLERIINRQLELSGYSKKIKDYVEKQRCSSTELILLLSKGEYTQVKFAGWDLIVQLSSGSVRDALVICESIWEQYGGESEHEKLKSGIDTISVDVQDKALQKYSEEVYASLINIESVGKEIFNIVRNFGEISRQCLKRGIAKEKDRRYELIAIERRDDKAISDRAADLLRKLIRHSVFIDRGLSFSREQIGLVQKFVLHRKYTPALKTTYREREHLRLGHKQLEQFLLNPDQFKEEFLRKFREAPSQTRLFDFEEADGNE
jgi:serine/threonine protein kinase